MVTEDDWTPQSKYLGIYTGPLRMNESSKTKGDQLSDASAILYTSLQEISSHWKDSGNGR